MYRIGRLETALRGNVLGYLHILLRVILHYHYNFLFLHLLHTLHFCKNKRASAETDALLNIFIFNAFSVLICGLTLI